MKKKKTELKGKLDEFNVQQEMPGLTSKFY